MKLLLPPIAAIFLWSACDLAQSKETTGWFVSDIRIASVDHIENRRPAKGSILEVKGTFQLVSSLNKSNSAADKIAVSEIKLAGYPDKGGKRWSMDPMAVGLNSPSGCNAYRFMDSKTEVSESQNLNGEKVEMHIKQGKLSLNPVALSPLCLAFVVPETLSKMVLTFSGTEVSIEKFGIGTQATYRQTVFIDERGMSGNILQQPSPTYPVLAKTARVEGSVTYSLTVGEDGRVIDVQTIRYDSALLQAGVAETLMLWQFRPTVINNVNVRVRTPVTVRFP